MYIEYVANIGVHRLWRLQLVEWITKQEMAAALQIHEAVISLVSLERLPQNFARYYITTMRRILRINDNKRYVGPDI